VRLNIRRGSRQIGGTCVELEAQGRRLVLDVGLPLDAGNPADAELPAVAGFVEPDPTLLGVVLSHPHLDHYGLAFRLSPATTFLMGAAAQRILEAAAVFTPSGGEFQRVMHLANRKPIILGPFTITPFLMDHSAYDSYAVLIEADGRKVFYTGDLRTHGRKGSLFKGLVAHPPADVDVLLMEGTTIGRPDTSGPYPTEEELVPAFIRLFHATQGIALVWCSGQNIDRLVTVFKATRKAGRQLILDMYTAHILKAAGNPRLPQADWDGVRVFLPEFQRRRIKRRREFALARTYRPFRIFPEQLAAAARKSVMLFRPSMSGDVEDAGCLAGAELVYSMWDGYLQDAAQQPFLGWLARHKIPLHKCHTSGHAPLCDLQRLRRAFSQAVVVPIHTEQPERFREYFEPVHVLNDGMWWNIGGKKQKRGEAMSEKNNNAELARMLKEALKRKTGALRGIRLPSAIDFINQAGGVRLKMKSKCVTANMQTDAASFECWALALQCWLKSGRIELQWTPAVNSADPHYQRFLYRVKKFQEVFGDWFAIMPGLETAIGKLMTADKKAKFKVNVESKPRCTSDKEKDASISDAWNDEHKLECFIAGNPGALAECLKVKMEMSRQMPVGVFNDAVAEGNEIFPSRHSAIDLWGVNQADKKLFLFELKKDKNIPIGILSEMFFYSFVMEDVQCRKFAFQRGNKLIEDTKSIAMFMLAPDGHPLIDADLLQFINTAFRAKNRQIRFGAIKLTQTAPHFHLEVLPAE